MSDKKPRFHFSFDIKNNKELSPYLFFPDLAAFSFATSFFTQNQIDYNLKNFMIEAISTLERHLNSSNDYKNNTKSIKKYIKRIISTYQNFISYKPNQPPFSIRDKYSIFFYLINTQKKSLYSFTNLIIKDIETELKQCPIPKQFFPSFVPENRSIGRISQLRRNANENKIRSILDKFDNMINVANKSNSTFLILTDRLNEINNILAQFPKPFSFSPILVNYALKKLDDILNSFYSPNNYENIYDNMKSSCYRLILIIKMRLHMMIHQMHNFLTLLIQFLNAQEENPEIKNDPLISFEENIPKILPDCSTSRSLIINNVSYKNVINFSFNNDSENDFILTTNGIFQVKNDKIKYNEIIDFDDLKPFVVYDKRRRKQFNLNEVKIAFSNGILYFLNLNEKVIHRIKFSDDEEYINKRLKILEKIKNSKMHLKMHHYSNRTKGKPNPKKKNKFTNKKQREMKKKKEKFYRKMERYKEIYHKKNLSPVNIDILDIPIISMGAFNNYIRIIQKISYEDRKTYLLFINIDLDPKSRLDFNIKNTFSLSRNNKSLIQTHQEIIIDDKNEQYKIQNILFSCDYMFVFFEDSSIDQYMIYKNGKIELFKQLISPFISFSNSVLKMDNKMFLYYMEPVDNHSIVFSKMNFSETKHWLREENQLFLKYPFLKKISSIINNCSQFILNRDMNTFFSIDDNNEINLIKNKNPIHMKVSPEEMSCIVQSPNSIVSQLSIIKDLIYDIDDEDLARFFVVMLIKLIGINLLYEFNDNEKIDENAIKIFKEFREFLMDLYSSFSHSSSIEFDIILDESIIFTTMICGKFLFYPNSFSDLQRLMNQILCDHYHYYSKLLLASFSSILFLYPSSLYFIDQSIYQILLEFEDEINIHELLMKSLPLILLEIKFSHKIMNDEFISFISPYIKVIINHLKYIISNNKIPFNIAKQIMSYFFCYDLTNVFFSLNLLTELTAICSDFHKRIFNFSDVIESENQFKTLKYDDIEKQEIHKETKVVERFHPFYCDISNKTRKFNKITKIIDFGYNTDTILVEFDKRCQFFENDQILLYPKYYQNPIHFGGKDKIKYNSAYKFKTNFIKVVILIDTNEDQKVNQNLWGYKIMFTGISTENPFYWIPNSNLLFYNYLISFMIQLHCHSFKSIEFTDSEKRFNGLLKDKIIQGINVNNDNFDDFENDIDYDFVKKIDYNVDTKKKILIDIIENEDLISKCLYLIYSKTSKLQKINLNNSTKSIFENEHYLIACLLKQLGLISEFLDFTEHAVNNDDDDDIPSNILLIWKKVYELRKYFFYIYQKSKSETDSEYNKSLIEIKNKCIYLLCSCPIMKYKEKDHSIKDIANTIYSFITSKIELSEISNFIENRRKRLSISSQSISNLQKIVDKNILSESSNYTLLSFYSVDSPFSKCKGLTEHEINDYSKLSGKLSNDLLQRALSNPLNEMTPYTSFLLNISLLNEDDYSIIQYSKKIIQLLEKYINNEQLCFNLIIILIYLASKIKSQEIIQYIISLLTKKDEITLLNKQLIVTIIPFFIQFAQDTFNNEKLIFTILENNKQNPIIVTSIFKYLMPSFFNQNKLVNHNFISNVLKGIGQSFTGKSCLFIDDSLQLLTHRQVSESMISFIKILFNYNSADLFSIIHETFMKSIESIEKDQFYILVGLFLSIEQTLSSFEPNRRILYNVNQNSNVLISSYNPSKKQIVDKEGNNKNINCVFTNSVIIDPRKLELNEKEIQNLLNFHNSIVNSSYFEGKLKYESAIDQNEITKDILITSFYSFLPLIFQNKNNVKFLFNKNLIKDTLSLFELSRRQIPSNENLVSLLSHYLEQSIFSPLFISVQNNERLNSFRFIKLNYGEIICEKENDVIKSDINYFNVFACNRPFDSKTETYFNIKIKKIGFKNIFIGIIISEDSDINKAIGFGSFDHKNIFCRKSPYLTNHLSTIVEESIEKKFEIKDGNSIGCFCTENFLYFTFNGTLTHHRISHMSFKSYVPIIFVDHDDVELEIAQNVSIVDHSDKKYDFLKITNTELLHENDIASSLQIKDEIVDNISTSYDIIDQNLFLVGQMVKFNQMNSNELNIETNYFNHQNFIENYGIIKEIIPLKNNKYVSKMKIEIFNSITLSKEIIIVDSRYVSTLETNFFNLLENRTETKFGFNSSFDLKFLPEKLRISSDLNSIKSYLKNKTINENSRSISIIMTRYLSFILVDYLRYSKSEYLMDDGIDSKESQIILNSLASSIPTITMFSPKFECSIDESIINDHLIFSDDQTSSYKIPGLSSCFHYSFIAFLKKAGNFLSQKFLPKLLQGVFDIVNRNDFNSILYFYEMISSKYKIESLLPLPLNFKYKTIIEKSDFCDDKNQNDIVGFITLLLSTIPSQLPCVVCCKRKLRVSSNDTSYFALFDFNQSFSLKWKYIENIKVDDYKLQCGIFILFNDLQENLLNGPLGFIQIIFILIQAFNNLNQNIIKEIYEKIFVLSNKKNALVNPFFKEIIIHFISKEGFNNEILLSKNSFEFFTNLKEKIYQIDEFSSYKNESSFFFQIYSHLITMKKDELSINNSKDELALLFEKYYEISNELFKDDDIEDSIKNPKNNVRLVYLLYYYSVLLRNDKNLPYPMFIFVHEYIRQHFGGFCLYVDKDDIDKYTEDCQVNDILYHSDMIVNDFDLNCFYKLVNIHGEKVDNEFNVFIHQNKDDQKILLSESKKIVVSFPFDILIVNNNSESKMLNDGDVFIIKIEPSKEQQKNFFISHYDEIINAFHQFISLQKYENEISRTLFNSKEGNDLTFIFQTSDESDEENEDEIENDERIVDLPLNIESNRNSYLQRNESINDNLNDLDNFDRILNDYENDYLNHLSSRNTEISLFDIPAFHFRNYHSSINPLHFFNHNIIYHDEIIRRTEKRISIYEKIPKIIISIQINDSSSFNDLVVSLRYFILSSYISLVDKIIKNHNNFNRSIWDLILEKSSSNLYEEQIITPIFSLSTEYKFKFIQQFLLKERKAKSKLKLKINRFEQQKFIEMTDIESNSSTKPLPFLFQVMKQVDEKSLHKLKVHNNNPFFVNLIGENAIDAGGPGREFFSCLMIEIMNPRVGVFTYNPNRQHNIKETNQEDLIPFRNAICYDETFSSLFSKRFVYVGALIAVCIVSGLPQPLKLSSLIWEYLTFEKVTIESVYEIDSNFKKFIENTEYLLDNSSNLNEDKFESVFFHAFDINDSFDNIIELVPSGSKKIVKKENLEEFIQLSKDFRIHEFDHELKELKKGFDIVMCYKNITKILYPNELKLLICGEPNCDINQMKKLIKVSFVDLNKDEEIKMEKMFWNVIESFSVDDRMKFIRFSSGNLGLPAPGLKWNEDIEVIIGGPYNNNNNNLAHASTCNSIINIPCFKNEDELEKILRVSIENSVLITDSAENLEIISNFL